MSKLFAKLESNLKKATQYEDNQEFYDNCDKNINKITQISSAFGHTIPGLKGESAIKATILSYGDNVKSLFDSCQEKSVEKQAKILTTFSEHFSLPSLLESIVESKEN